MFCLEHPDPCIQQKTVALLTAIANPGNVKPVVDAILAHLKKMNKLKSGGSSNSIQSKVFRDKDILICH